MILRQGSYFLDYPVWIVRTETGWHVRVDEIRFVDDRRVRSLGAFHSLTGTSPLRSFENSVSASASPICTNCNWPGKICMIIYAYLLG